MRISVWAICFLALVACSSKSKKESPLEAQPVASAAPTPVVEKPKVSRNEILDRFSLLELNAAANVLHVIVNHTSKDSSLDGGTELVGCEVKGSDAVKMISPLQSLIESQSEHEREAYADNPPGYAKDHGFETCASTCSCGLFSTAFANVNESSFKKGSPEMHKRYLAKLRAKARLQDSEMSTACARNQIWFCKSELKTYLEEEKAAPQP